MLYPSRLPNLRAYAEIANARVFSGATSGDEDLVFADRARFIIVTCSNFCTDRGSRLFAPRFMCLDGLFVKNCNLVLYDLLPNYEPVASDLEGAGEGDIVLLVNFFGFSTGSSLVLRERLKGLGCLVILDNCHSYSLHLIASRQLLKNECTVTSYIKSLPLPFGAELRAADPSKWPFLFKGIASRRKHSLLSLQSSIYFIRDNLGLAKDRELRIKFDQRFGVSGERRLYYNRPWVLNFLFNIVNQTEITSVREKNYKKIRELYADSWPEPSGRQKDTYSIVAPPTDFPVMSLTADDSRILKRLLFENKIAAYRWPRLTKNTSSARDDEVKSRTLLLPMINKYPISVLEAIRKLAPIAVMQGFDQAQKP